jgi:hypothetical protein
VKRTRSNSRAFVAVTALVTVLHVAPVSAQIDPLLFIKSTQPNVIVAVDVATRMQRDAPTNPSDPFGTSSYYDTSLYTFSLLNLGVNSGLVLDSSNTTSYYRRKYNALKYASNASGDKFETTGITRVGDQQGSSYTLFEATTRISVARAAIDQVIKLNQTVARFGLVKMRQSSPGVATEGNTGPVANSNPSQQVGDLPGSGKWAIGLPTVGGKNGTVSTSGLLVQADAANANTTILTTVGKNTRTAGGLLPAGDDDANTVDAPIKYMLDDARAEAARLIAADTSCRNTIVVLIAGGKEGNTAGSSDPAVTASTFLNVSGRRVPIYVIAIAPPDADRSQLQDIATNSGGQYFEITKAMIDEALAFPTLRPASNTAAPTGTVVVAEVVKAMNVAVQHAFASFADFNSGVTSEFSTGSPLVGTVNLENAKDITGASLPNTIVSDPHGAEIPQRSNVLLNSGFALPSFDGKLRAFRMYKPIADSTQQSGYKFVNDGTRLWVASVPSASSRNIYTYLPGVGMIAFTTINAVTLAPYMNLSQADATTIINYVRNQPLGAIVGSTPAVMDPPSVDPPPDSEYPGFAATNANRRTIIWLGTNDGLFHAIDGRLGKEVWAFIPFNFLPKLKELPFGQSIGKFNYFADGSAKIADVRASGPCPTGLSSCWRTYLFFGEGPGGTFYQALDVTLDNMESTVSPTSDTISNVLSYFSDAGTVAFKWSFPGYSSFDHTLSPWGDIRSTAPTIEKTVGQSWADPAVGKIESAAGKFALVLGSGFLPYTTEQQANRAGVVAGTTFYVLNVETGEVFDSVSVGSDGLAETVDSCVVANDCAKIKNALQADPVATGPPNSRYITMAYVGDLDGRVWRFDLGMNSSSGNPYIKNKPGTKLWDGTAAHPIFSSMATVNVGSTQQYVFFGTGSDLLASNNVSQQYKLVGVLDNGGSGTQTFSTLLTKVDGVGADEKVTAFPAVAGDIVFFTTTTFNPATPCALPSAKLYAFTFIGGPAYDTNGNGSVSAGDSIIVATIAGARATAPFVADRHLVFGSGTQTQIFGDPEAYDNGVGQAGVRILSWRELR